MGLSRRAQAQLPHGLWDLLRPGIAAVSPALAGGVLTTGPAGKSEGRLFKRLCNGEIGGEGVNVSGIDRNQILST